MNTYEPSFDEVIQGEVLDEGYILQLHGSNELRRFITYDRFRGVYSVHNFSRCVVFDEYTLHHQTLLWQYIEGGILDMIKVQYYHSNPYSMGRIVSVEGVNLLSFELEGGHRVEHFTSDELEKYSVVTDVDLTRQ